MLAYCVPARTDQAWNGIFNQITEGSAELKEGSAELKLMKTMEQFLNGRQQPQARYFTQKRIGNLVNESTSVVSEAQRELEPHANIEAKASLIFWVKTDKVKDKDKDKGYKTKANTETKTKTRLTYVEFEIYKRMTFPLISSIL